MAISLHIPETAMVSIGRYFTYICAATLWVHHDAFYFRISFLVIFVFFLMSVACMNYCPDTGLFTFAQVQSRAANHGSRISLFLFGYFTTSNLLQISSEFRLLTIRPLTYRITKHV